MPWIAKPSICVIRAFKHRKPFRLLRSPWWMATRLEIDHPEALVSRDGTGIFLAPGGVP